MINMFYHVTDFNQAIGGWDTSRVTTMKQTLCSCDSCLGAFNQPLDGWDTSKVMSTFRMFYRQPTFDQEIGSWDTARVGDMKETFVFAAAFNSTSA